MSNKGFFRNICTLTVFLILVGCSQKQVALPRPAPYVTVVKAQSKDVPYYIDAIGQASAYVTVNLVPQVTGILTHSYFIQGQKVRAGDLLLTIDDRSYVEALKQAEGQLQENQANLDYNQQVVKSYAGLLKDEYVSKLNYQQFQSNVVVTESLVKQSQAAVETAMINLSYTKIFAPFDGVIGIQIIDNGNLVTAGQTNPIAVINQVTPIRVQFAVPERFFSDVKKYYHTNPLMVVATIPGTTISYTGVMSFLDNAINAQTGTFIVKGTFKNEDQALWPGQYVDVNLILYTIPKAVLVPSEAIKLDTQGNYVFVVDENQVAEKRVVTLGQIQGNETVILTGLNVGETIVVEGQLGVIPGQTVQIKSSAAKK
ncbi:MAG: efflux RND transporter periplasmic adaptor subunit [Parachlamydiales bacterium]|nr:efflux RND transporter periplasmic adaptor subunit [Parachlamydiales bacterium]